MTKSSNNIGKNENYVNSLSGVFEIHTCHDTLLAKGANNQLIHKKSTLISPRESKLQLLKCDSSNLALLFTENLYDGHFKWSAIGWLQNCQLVRLTAVDKNMKVIISHVAHVGLITPSNIFNEHHCGLVRTDTIKANSYEKFDLIKSFEKKVPKDIMECLSWFTRNIDNLFYLVNAFLKLLSISKFSNIQKRLITPNLLSLLTNSQLEQLSQHLLDNQKSLTAFIDVFPDDKFGVIALRELYSWKVKRNKNEYITRLLSDGNKKNNNKVNLPTSLDFLSRIGQNSHSISPSHLINSFARQTIRPEKSACVIATARNEGIYLLEWVAYYKALGFDEIFLYSNDNSDSSDELLKALADEGIITWIENEVSSDGNAQGKAYGHALSFSPEVLLYDWALIVDVDEFFSYNTDIYDSLDDFLSEHSRSEADVIAINWLYIGSSGISFWENKPLLSRLNYQVGKVNPHIKSFVKPNRVFQSGPHFPKADERTTLSMRSASGKPHHYGKANVAPSISAALSDEPDDSAACLFHFFNRTAEEFLWKWSRNRGDYPKSEGDIYLALEERFLIGFLNQFHNTENNAIEHIQKCIPDLDKHIKELLKVNAIQLAQVNVTARFVERSDRVVKAYKPLLKNNFGESGRRMLALIDKGE